MRYTRSNDININIPLVKTYLCIICNVLFAIVAASLDNERIFDSENDSDIKRLLM